MKITKIFNFLKIAEVISENSPDTKRKVGAILVHKQTRAILATGFNGYVRGAPDQDLPNGDDDKKHEYIIHAEQNLLCNASRHGSCTADSIVICTLSPCKRCLRLLWNAGIAIIYFPIDRTYKDLEESSNMGDLQIEQTLINGLIIKLKLSAKKGD